METQPHKPMKTTRPVLAVVFGLAWLTAGCGTKQSPSPSSWSLDQSGAATQLKQFVAAQEAQARSLAKQDGNQLPPDFDAFYRAAEAGDWQAVTNLFARMSKSTQNDNRLRGSWWSATLDAYGVFELFPPGDKYAVAYGRDIIQSIPAGSIPMNESRRAGRWRWRESKPC